MALPRIPPPPRSNNTTPNNTAPAPNQLETTDLLGSFDEHQYVQQHEPPIQPRRGDLIALDTPLNDDAKNPHLQMYTGPTADFEQIPVKHTMPTDPPAEKPVLHHISHSHMHSRLHPPRRLSEIFSSAGPTSPPAVSSESGNAGFTVPTVEEFGVFKSGAEHESDFGAEAGRSSSPGKHRRMSSFDGLWRGLHLGTGSVGTFPARRRSKEEGQEHADVFHEDDHQDEPHDQTVSPASTSPTSAANSSWKRAAGGLVASTLGSTLKAKSKWKSVLGPSSFHPPTPSAAPLPSGYALHGWSDETLAAPTSTARPISISHQSPFAPAPGTGTPGTTSASSMSTMPVNLGNPFANVLSGAPGFRREDTYLGTTRPARDEAGKEEREWRGTKLVGRREGTDAILDEGVADALRPFLPPRQRLARSWTLLFSTDQHGASLSTFYRLIAAHEHKNPQAGNLLVVRDAQGARFGVYMNEAIRRVEGAYTGSGESWLFKLVGQSPDVRACVFKWTGKNHYFALCESDFISFGGGDGRYGLWIDRNFYNGSSARCPAYDNEVLCDPEGSTREAAKFDCYGLEVWAT